MWYVLGVSFGSVRYNLDKCGTNQLLRSKILRRETELEIKPDQTKLNETPFGLCLRSIDTDTEHGTLQFPKKNDMDTGGKCPCFLGCRFVCTFMFNFCFT